MKRGQATFFVVVGLILLVTLSLTYYAITIQETRFIQQAEETPPIQTANPIKYLIDKCLSVKIREGIKTLGNRGGYIDIPYPGLEMQWTSDKVLAMFFVHHKGAPLPKKIIPSLPYMEEELAKYVKDEIRYCFFDFRDFIDRGMRLNMQEALTNVTITDNAITASLYFPVEVKKGGDEIQFKEYSLAVPLRVGEMHKLAQEIVDETERYENALKGEIKKKVNNCDLTGEQETAPRFEHIFAKYPKLNVTIYPPEGNTMGDECQRLFEKVCKNDNNKKSCVEAEDKKSLYCDGLTLQVQLNYKLAPGKCTLTTNTVFGLLPLSTIYAVTDNEAEIPFTYLFMTKMNVDTEGQCSQC